MIKIALTGGIGCGKSTVCKFFSEHNTPVIDTDVIARELVEPGKQALTEISDYFGPNILFTDGSLNRKSLAHKVFNNKKHRLQLESILHPKIKQQIQTQINKLDSAYVIVAIPLLVETNQQTEYDRVLVIDCNEQQQIDRTVARDSREIDEVKSIMSSQVSRTRRIEVANDVIDNSHDLNTLKSQVKKLHLKYMKLVNSA